MDRIAMAIGVRVDALFPIALAAGGLFVFLAIGISQSATVQTLG